MSPCRVYGSVEKSYTIFTENMSKFETQINQVYLVHPDSKKSSLVLYEETLQPKLHLFVLLELVDIKRKTEANELKKISEVILSTFRKNQKMPASTLFEATLAQINQNLGEIAHKGAKNWLGKFSAVIALKSDQEIFFANTGAACAWIKRKRDFSEVLGPEKKGDHPLKTFLNFASGRVKEADCIILTTTNLFNFVSLELLTKLLGKYDLAECCNQVSKILQDSAGKDDAFAAFFLEFHLTQQPMEEFAPEIQPAQVVAEPILKEPVVVVQEPTPEFMPVEDIYAPLPENLKAEKQKFSLPKVNLSSLTNFSFLKKIKIKLPSWKFFNKLSISGKFFLISFAVFLLVFVINLAIWGTHTFSKKQTAEVNALVESINHDLAEASSALIYKDDDQAVKNLQSSQDSLEKLKILDEVKYAQLIALYNKTADRINRVTRVENPKTVGELKLNPLFIAKAGENFLLSGSDSKSVSTFSDTFKTIFLLNSTDGDVTGIGHIPGNGNWITTAKHIYRVNEVQKQFEKISDFPNANLIGLKYLAPSRVYVADKNTNQILRMQVLANGSAAAPQALLKTTADLSTLQDFGLDVDIYLLFPSTIKKFVAGKEQLFRLDKLSDPMTSATKIFVGSNLYVLEPAKRRLLIFAKDGNLLNQIYLPNSSELKDFYIDENQRRLDVINGNSLIEITI